MKRVSSKAAARRFHAVLKDADAMPVMIERHGRPRAVVVSARRFQVYEKLLANYIEETAVATLEDGLDHAANGNLGRAATARRKAAGR